MLLQLKKEIVTENKNHFSKMRKLHIFVIFTLKQSRIFLICLSGSLDIVTTFIIKLMRLLKLAVGIQDHIIKTKKIELMKNPTFKQQLWSI